MPVIITNKGSSGSSSGTIPTVQVLTSALGTYTTPSSPAPLYLRVTVVGDGGGGSTDGGAMNGTDGTGSTFGTSLLSAGPGMGGVVQNSGPGGAGGTPTVTSPAVAVISLTGGTGANAYSTIVSNAAGGNGGMNAFGGAGPGGTAGTDGSPGTPGTGAGGGGGAGEGNVSPAFTPGAGGGAGAFIVAIIPSPSSTYLYTVGQGGAGGTTGASNGGNGASGQIIVEEFYQ